MNDTVSIVLADAFGEDGLMGEVEIDEALPQGVPAAFFLHVIFRVLVQHAFQLQMNGLKLLPDLPDLLLYAV